MLQFVCDNCGKAVKAEKSAMPDAPAKPQGWIHLFGLNHRCDECEAAAEEGKANALLARRLMPQEASDASP